MRQQLENCQWQNKCDPVLRWSTEVADNNGWAANPLPDPFEGIVGPLLEEELDEEDMLWRRAVLLERVLRSNDKVGRLLDFREYARAMLHVLRGAGNADSLTADLHRVTFSAGQIDQLLLSARALLDSEEVVDVLRRVLVVLHGDKDEFAVERFVEVFGQAPICFNPDYRLDECASRDRSGLGKWTDCPMASKSAEEAMMDVDERRPLDIVHDTHWGSFFSMVGGRTINFKGGKHYPFYDKNVPSGLVFFGAAPTHPAPTSRFGHVRLTTTLDQAVNSFAQYWDTDASSVHFYMLSTRVYCTFTRWTALVTTRRTELGDAIPKDRVVEIANLENATVDFAFDLGLHHDGYSTRPFSGSWSVSFDDIVLTRVEHSTCTSVNYARRRNGVNDVVIIDTHNRSRELDDMMTHWFPVPENEMAETSTGTAEAQSKRPHGSLISGDY